MSETVSLGEQVASQIRVELARQRKTQTSLADDIGLPPSGLSRRMNGEIPFSTDDIEKIARQLGLEPGQLMLPVTR